MLFKLIHPIDTEVLIENRRTEMARHVLKRVSHDTSGRVGTHFDGWRRRGRCGRAPPLLAITGFDALITTGSQKWK